jgi:hypothetical protein
MPGACAARAVSARLGSLQRLQPVVLRAFLSVQTIPFERMMLERLIDAQNDHHLMLVQTSASRAEWEAHMATPHLARFRTDGAPLAAGWTIAQAERRA